MRKHPLLAFATTVLVLSVFGAFARSRPAIGTTAPHRTPRQAAVHPATPAHLTGLSNLTNPAMFAGGLAPDSAARVIVAFRVGAPLRARALRSQPPVRARASRTWQELRSCESGGNYRANTGNGYFGAYQFAAQTWWAIGEHGLPDTASPSEQDTAAQHLVERVGWRAWPSCSVALGLS